ncbi:MAG: hypothetical protein ACK5MI_01250 [Mangrovibacterium sp.]
MKRLLLIGGIIFLSGSAFSCRSTCNCPAYSFQVKEQKNQAEHMAAEDRKTTAYNRTDEA